MTNPMLRFSLKDGNSYPDWSSKSIESLCGEVLGGGTPSKSNVDYWKGTIPWISSSDLSLDKINEFSISRHISEDAVKHSATKLIKKDSVLIVSRVGVGKVAVAPVDLCTSQDFTNLVAVKCNPYFLAYALSKLMQIKARSVQGTAIKGIPATELKQIHLSIPCEEEQQEIASFFATLDEKISLSEHKLEALEQLKKELMQKIFGGEIRFKPDLSGEYPSWRKMKLREFAALLNGRAYKQGELLASGKYRVLRVGNFFTSDEWYFSDLNLDASKYADKGDLLYAWSASFGPKMWNEEKVIYHYHIWKVMHDAEKVTRQFLYFLLEHDVSSLRKDLNGGTMAHLTKVSMESREFLLPCLEEQQKISDFFSVLDQKISLAKRTNETLQTLKRGFMQQMFV